MSRVGKKPIPVPSGVKIQIGEQLKVQGPKGTLEVPIPAGIRVKQNGGELEFIRDSDEHAALHGLTRALAANAVQGVSTGFTRELDIVGIGYRADVKGKIATFTLGYSHPIEVLLPDGVDLKIDKQTHLVLSGYDRQMLGQVAANIRALRKPDPYKNKGVRYTGEVLKKKVGKSRRYRRQEVNDSQDFEKRDPRAHAHPHPQEVAGHHGAAASGGLPQRRAHLCAGDRRYEGRHAGGGQLATKKRRRQKGTGGNVAAAKEIGKRVAERAKERASTRWCSTVAAISITAA